MGATEYRRITPATSASLSRRRIRVRGRCGCLDRLEVAKEPVRPIRPPLPCCGPMELEEVSAAYDEALRCVMSDLTGTTDLSPDVVVDFTDPGDLQYWYRPWDGSSRGSSLMLDEDGEAATVRLADLIQDDALEELWGTAWPTCPGHNHPAQPSLQDGRATWVCPRSHRPLAPIGDLAP
jgi:hypothetical protein